jgi:hypothetical protein
VPNAVGLSRGSARQRRDAVVVSGNGGRGSATRACLVSSRCHGEGLGERRGPGVTGGGEATHGLGASAACTLRRDHAVVGMPGRRGRDACWPLWPSSPTVAMLGGFSRVRWRVLARWPGLEVRGERGSMPWGTWPAWPWLCHVWPSS